MQMHVFDEVITLAEQSDMPVTFSFTYNPKGCRARFKAHADAEAITVTYPDIFALMRDLRGMGETNALAGRRRGFLRRATLARAATIYAERFSNADGRIRATFEILFLTGWAPDPSQPKPLRRGSASHRMVDVFPSNVSPPAS